MLPGVGQGSNNDFEGYSFDMVWEYLIKIGIINQITFKKVLILLYRICFMLDHIDDGKSRIRYRPSKELTEYINKIDFIIKEGYNDKFKTSSVGLLEFLNFVDILGWNEDMKYHTINDKP
jgi:hypothetical protein